MRYRMFFLDTKYPEIGIGFAFNKEMNEELDNGVNRRIVGI